MPVTAASMQARILMLSTAPEALLTSCIAAAEAQVSSAVWGDLYDEGVLYLAAHKATLDPAGVKARKVDQSGRGVFLAEFERLQSCVVGGGSVSAPTVTDADLGIIT